MSERKTLSVGDWIGVAIFLVGTLGAVLMALALFRGTDGAQGTGRIATVVADTIGAIPMLVLASGVAFLGARKFLTGAGEKLVLHVIGLVGVAAGLAMILGAWSGTAGGNFGAATGGRIALATHTVVGAFLGLLVAFGFAWIAWMRPDPSAAARVAPPRRTTSAPPRGDDGVSAAESQALFPQVEIPAAKPKPTASQVLAPAPYPEDVRQKGEVPPGAKPIASPIDAGPVVYRWTAPRTNAPVAEPAAAPTAPRVEVEAPVARVTPLVERNVTPIAQPIADRGIALDAPAVAGPAQTSEPEPLALFVEEEVQVEPEEAPAPIAAPAWERTGLAPDEERVDAYGTPRSTVEQVQREMSTQAPLAVPAEIGALDEHVDEPDAADELDVADELPIALAAAHETTPSDVVETLEPDAPFQLGPVDEELDSISDEAREIGATEAPVAPESSAASVALDAHDEPTLLAAEPDEAPSAEQAPLASTVAPVEPDPVVTTASADAAPSVEPAAPVEAPRAETMPAADLAPRTSAPEPRGSIAPQEVAASATADATLNEPAPTAEPVTSDEPAASDADEPAVEKPARRSRKSSRAAEPEVEEPVAPLAELAPVEDRKPARATAATLFDAVETPATEREVVLQPQAAVPPSRAEKSPARIDGARKELLSEVGCLFVERGRVAVSMLQRQYAMEFDDACKVLDELQDLGLIGPYLGGQRRDILLSREQWLEKVSGI